MVALMMTLLLFSYRLADRVLVGIHGSRCLQILLAGLAIVVAVVDCGRAFLMGELIFILLMAGMVYPFKQLPQKQVAQLGFLATGKELSLIHI